MKNIIMLLVLVLGFTVNAQDTKDKNAKHTIEVNGNCEMCKKRIEQAAYSVKGVKSANWDIGSHQMNLIVNEQKTSLEEIEKSIAKAGHDTDNAKATEADYDELHACCMYERE